MMNAEHKTTDPAMQAGATLGRSSVPSAARRRLLRGGLAVAPVVLASAPRSVMAGGVAGVCVPASSFMSVNTSRPNSLPSCSGRSPDFWQSKENFTYWRPTQCVPEDQLPLERATRFNDVIGRGTMGYDKTLLEVLRLSGGGRDAVARYIVAAFLNARAGLTSPRVLDETTVKSIWYSFENQGFFEPTAGIRWNADSANVAGAGGIIPWLKSTMPI